MPLERYRPPSGDSPCSECPFRRKSAAGWLGDATPQSFISEISLEHPLPCHPTIDYADPDWLEKWTSQSIGRICAGSLILSANMGKLPRDPKFPRLPPDGGVVFGNHLQFIAHHEGSEVRSWELAEGAPKEIRVASKETKTKVSKIAVVTDDSVLEQLRRLIAHSRIGRQNAHTRALRTDAQSVLDHGPGLAHPAAELCAKKLRELTSIPEAVGVYAIDRSPMNKLRWVLSLFCGHTAWETSKSMPSKRLVDCEACRRRAQGSAGGGADIKPAPSTPVRRRRFYVRADIEIEIDQRVIDVALAPEWRASFYDLKTEREVVEHIAFNLVQDRRLTSLDGWADQDDGMARIEEIDVTDAEDITDERSAAPTQRRTRSPRPTGRTRRGSSAPRK